VLVSPGDDASKDPESAATCSVDAFAVTRDAPRCVGREGFAPVPVLRERRAEEPGIACETTVGQTPFPVRTLVVTRSRRVECAAAVTRVEREEGQHVGARALSAERDTLRPHAVIARDDRERTAAARRIVKVNNEGARTARDFFHLLFFCEPKYFF
jgi:hypothetical protein